MNVLKKWARLLPLTILLPGCNGGGSSGGEVVVSVAAEPAAIPIVLLDSIPASGTNSVDANRRGFSFVHTTGSTNEFNLEMDCMGLEVFSVRRSLMELSDPNTDQLVDHRFSCPGGLEAGADYTLKVLGVDGSGDQIQGAISFQAEARAGSINVLQQKSLTRSELEGLFDHYVAAGVVDKLGLSKRAEDLLLAYIIDLAASAWDNLSDPDVLYEVISQRVEYPSIAPDGTFSNALTGLVAFPDIRNEAFEPRSEVILLTHATGSTPSNMELADAWFILANLIAGHGYLVVAPDNFGRGGTKPSPETYLQGNRTAINAIDLLIAVSDSGDYEAIANSAIPVGIQIIGYSQGGHTAIASWLEILRHHHQRFETRFVHSGGSPFDLYKTFRGVLQHINNSCEDDGYCDLVDTETTVAFATDRILPGLLAYASTGLTQEDVITGEGLNPNLVTGFLAGDASYDNLKAMLQLSSYTNIVNAAEVFNDELVTINLYHSDFDRLVSVNNSRDFADTLEGNVRSTLHRGMCNSTGFRLIFESVDKVGIIHTLCGLNVLDAVFDQLR